MKFFKPIWFNFALSFLALLGLSCEGDKKVGYQGPTFEEAVEEMHSAGKEPEFPFTYEGFKQWAQKYQADFSNTSKEPLIIPSAYWTTLKLDREMAVTDFNFEGDLDLVVVRDNRDFKTKKSNHYLLGIKNGSVWNQLRVTAGNFENRKEPSLRLETNRLKVTYPSCSNCGEFSIPYEDQAVHFEWIENHFERKINKNEIQTLKKGFSTIEKYFVELRASPDQLIPRTVALLRYKKTLPEYLQNEGEAYRIEDLEKKDGYIHYLTNISDDSWTDIEMVYWRQAKSSLVGLSSSDIAFECNRSSMDFYRTRDGKDFKYLQYSSLVPGFDKTTFQEDPSQEPCKSVCLVHVLPKEGKDIKVFYNDLGCGNRIKANYALLKYSSSGFKVTNLKMIED